MKQAVPSLLLGFALIAFQLNAQDGLDSLRKAGAKIAKSPDGSISVHFSVPQPPRGPFGEPVFDPNFRPPTPTLLKFADQ